MKFILANFIANRAGATAIEYALIASLIAVALVGALSNTSQRMKSVFNEVSSVLK